MRYQRSTSNVMGTKAMDLIILPSLVFLHHPKTLVRDYHMMLQIFTQALLVILDQ